MMPSINRHSGRKQCNCCPYGYHIDLDFVRYCESISNLQLEPRRKMSSSYAQSRKKRASMEVLLGIPILPQIRPELFCNDGQAKASPQVGDAFQKAVVDFEQTLQRSTAPHPQPVDFAQVDSDLKEELIGLFLKKKIGLRKEYHEETKENFIPEALTEGSSSNMSASALQVIREQMANSLERMKELEEQVKLIPVLQDQLVTLKTEKKELLNKLKQEEEIKKTGSAHICRSDHICDQRAAPVILKLGNENYLPKTRNVSIGFNVVTRDVGVSPVQCLVVSSESQTEKYASPTSSVSFTDASTCTDLKMDHLYSQDDLNRNIDKAIKVYEETFHHLLHPKKIITLSTGVQVGGKLSSNYMKEVGCQVKPTTRDFSCLNQPKTKHFNMQTHTIQKDVGISDHTIYDTCAKCSAKKFNVGINFPEDSKGLYLLSLGGRSRSFHSAEAKRCRSVACGPVKPTLISKSIETIVTEKKDVSVNTMKRKLVDAPVETSNLPCPKCAVPGSRSGAVSRIPRPTTLPVPTQTRAYIRQDTYTKIQSDIKGKKLQEEVYGSDSGSEDGTVYSKEANFSQSFNSASVFQPIQAKTRQKIEPSKEMKAAMKVLNDSLQKSPNGNIENQVKSAINIIQQEWFKISSTAEANPLEVEDYLDSFEEVSSSLLGYIVNFTDVTGNTAMHYAISHGNFDVVSILLDSKVCNINQPNSAGYTCIMLVSLAQIGSETHRQVVRRLFLLSDVNIRAKQYGQTALMLAASHGHIDTVQLLLESGADINIQDEDGSTALMCAVEHGHIDIVKLLLAQPDCDVTITDYDGSTALNIAMQAGNREIGVLLYAQEHFPGENSVSASLKYRRAKSATPTMKASSPKPLSSPLASGPKAPDHSV